jgi:ATP-dependent helicase YprA (DUF1998 family)
MNNSYAKRMRQHRERQAGARRARLDAARADRVIAVDNALSEYERAYKEANGVRCCLIYRGGWVYMAECATFRVRLKDLGHAAQELYAAAHDRELDAPE